MSTVVRRITLVVVTVVLLAGFAVACNPPSFSTNVVVSDLDRPWDIGFLPNGTMIVSERPGRLSRIVGGDAQLIVAPSDVRATSEGGMLGLVVDPQFATNGYVFVCMSSTAGTVDDVRLVRFTLSQDGASVLARQDVLTGLPLSTGRHSGCRPRFGPDGYVWVGTGDAAIGTVPQDPASNGGKVLRLTRNGTPAPGNPFGLPWWTRGHRNVQGLAFRPSDGAPFSVEHGSFRDDEVNRLVVVGNYGWDPVPGYNEGVPMTDLVKFPDAQVARWTSGATTIAPSGASFISGSQWGVWNGALAVTVLKDRQLRVFFLDASGRPYFQHIVLQDRGRLRSIVQGPDGNLYVSTDNGGGTDVVLRLTPGALDAR